VLADAPQGQFAGIGFVLQVEEQRVAGQQAVLRPPRLRLLAQQQVGPGADGERGEAGVHAFGVGREQPGVRPGDRGQVRRHPCPQAVHAVAAVTRQGALAEQGGQFAGRESALQVHLEEALLPMHEAERPGEVERVFGVEGDHALGVAFDRHRCREAGQGEFAFVGGQAAAQRQPGGHEQQQREHHQGDDTAQQPPAHGESFDTNLTRQA